MRNVLTLILLLCATAFCWGTAGHHLTIATEASPVYVSILFLVPLVAAWLTLRTRWSELGVVSVWRRRLERHAGALDTFSESWLPLLIALAAGLGLFAELALIRLHSSLFQLFSYFKNLSLLSCFLGLGIGYSRSGRGLLATPWVLPLLTLQIGALTLLTGLPDAPFLQNPVPEQPSLGLEDPAGLASLVAVFGLIGLTFTVNALCFVPLGQLAGHLMRRLGKLRAYGWNLLGSLLGILLFNLASYLWSPPAVWMLVVTLLLLVFLSRRRKDLLPAAVAAPILLVVLAGTPSLDHYDVFSPYQKLTVRLHHDKPTEIQVANVYYQRLLDFSRGGLDTSRDLLIAANYYGLPYLFKPAPGRVLVVGSGTGNDVAAALRHGAGRVDAVEIDPAILGFGRLFHPEQPYSSEHVRAHNDDARSYLRTTEETYDLIVYGLLDSHTLLSGMASVRLDSFVYTVEAFREARARLAPGGVLSVSFATAHPQIAKKIFLMLEEAWDGQKPRAFFSVYDAGVSFLIGDDLELSAAAGVDFREITPILEREDLVAYPSTDDWPFLYMPERKYPFSYLLMVVFLTALSVAGIRQLTPGASGFSLPCFFLGAGFMLIETKAITELALVYGSTWVVIGVVISAILIMAYLANWVVQKGFSPPRWVTYPLLVVSVAGGLLVIGHDWSSLPETAVRLLLTAALTVPLFFSGLAFSEEIAVTGTVAGALASNMLGAMLGGFLEYNAMYFGYRSLYFLAMAMYVVAFVGSRRRGG